MRVLHVIDSLSGSGGAERGLVREITRFSADVDQEVATLYDRPDLEPELARSGIETSVLGLVDGAGSRSWPLAVPRLRRIANDFGPDVIQTSLFLGNMVGQVVGRMARVPVVSNLVLSGDLELLRTYQPGAETLKARALRGAAGLAARKDNIWFRALTEEVKASNASLMRLDPDRIEVIPRGVDMPSPSSVSRQSLGLPEGPLVVNVGRLVPQKGQTLLIQAFADVKAAVPDAHLVIVGRAGTASHEVEMTIDQTGLADSVLLVGYTTRVHEYLRVADIFAFSSLMEGLGTAVLEAMSHALPVVAFDIPPVREAMGDGEVGSLIPVGDTAAMAAAIVARLAEGALDEAAQELVQSNHDPNLVAERVENLLRRAATSP